MWLGHLGRLTRIRSPLRGVEATATRVSNLQPTVGGRRSADRTRDGTRDYRLQWLALPVADFAVLEGYYLGHRGPGSLVFVDPSRSNLLSVNQSSGTEARSDTSGFDKSAGSIVSSTSAAWQDLRSLLWTVDETAGDGGYVKLPWRHPGALDGTPAVPGQAYTWSAYLSGSSASLSLRLDLVWLDATYATISTTTGTPAAPAGSLASFAPYMVTGTAPSNAVYVQPRVACPTGIDGAFVAVDGCQLQMADAVSDWVAGTGVPIVVVTELTDAYPLYGVHDVTMILSEIG